MSTNYKHFGTYRGYDIFVKLTRDHEWKIAKDGKEYFDPTWHIDQECSIVQARYEIDRMIDIQEHPEKYYTEEEIKNGLHKRES